MNEWYFWAWLTLKSWPSFLRLFKSKEMGIRKDSYIGVQKSSSVDSMCLFIRSQLWNVIHNNDRIHPSQTHPCCVKETAHSWTAWNSIRTFTYSNLFTLLVRKTSFIRFPFGHVKNISLGMDLANAHVFSFLTAQKRMSVKTAMGMAMLSGRAIENRLIFTLHANLAERSTQTCHTKALH